MYQNLTSVMRHYFFFCLFLFAKKEKQAKKKQEIIRIRIHLSLLLGTLAYQDIFILNACAI